jgi:excisionase family DNA binding protein
MPCDAENRTFPWKGDKNPRRKVFVSPKPTEEKEIPNVPVLLYSIEEAAHAIGLSTRTVGNLLRQGRLVRRKVGSRTLVPVSSVEAFVRKDHGTGQSGKRKKGSAR